MSWESILAGAILYGMVCVVVMIFWGSIDPWKVRTSDIVWWPITLLKFLFRTLWEALTTGWKP